VDENSLILIVEDDLDVAEMLVSFFQRYDYRVEAVDWGKKALVFCRSNKPDVVILDIRLPDIDGFGVAFQLRENPRTTMIPIIFLTERQTRESRLKGLRIGGDDYITKPFDIQELRLRVENAIKRSKRKSLTHPVTGLPKGNLVEESLFEFLDIENNPGLLLLEIQGLEHFRDRYGFSAADDTFRAVSLMPTRLEQPLRYYGHLDDMLLVIIADRDSIPLIQQGIQELFNQAREIFYPLEDLGKSDLPEVNLNFFIPDLKDFNLESIRDLDRVYYLELNKKKGEF
jgi:DNA-binding response OmpR family regulator